MRQNSGLIGAALAGRAPMISIGALLGSALLLMIPGGCPGAEPSGDPLGNLVGRAPGNNDGGDKSGNGDVPPTRVSGRVVTAGEYRLFELGPAGVGDRWRISADGALPAAFIVVMLDDRFDLLERAQLVGGGSLEHIVREATGAAYVGVMPTVGSPGGDFALRISRVTGMDVPAPHRQVVYVNFEGGKSVRVHGRAGITFGAFDSGVFGPQYAGLTNELKHEIIDMMRSDYAQFDVELHSSDDGPPPGVPDSTVYFGGHDSSLLGLADNVDSYNSDPRQVAIIYAESFAPYQAMHLTPDEFATMLANVGSHELGHLLGLYHTQDPDELMDTTGSAWDLAGLQAFGRSPLESSVFAMGYSDAPTLLEQTVGRTEAGDVAARASARFEGDADKMMRRLEMRRFMAGEIRGGCGICREIDGR